MAMLDVQAMRIATQKEIAEGEATVRQCAQVCI